MRDLECAICSEIFSDPRVLTCGHSFCFECITLYAKSQWACPTCRQEVLPKKFTMDPVKNFSLSNLAEGYQKDTALKRSRCLGCDSYATHNFFFHCVTDKEERCSNCILLNHKDHDYLKLADYKGKVVETTGTRQLEQCLNSLALAEKEVNDTMEEQKNILTAFPLIRELSSLVMDKYVKTYPVKRRKEMEKQTANEITRRFVEAHSSDEFQNLACEASTLSASLAEVSNQIFNVLTSSFIESGLLERVNTVRRDIREQLGPDLRRMNSFCTFSGALAEAFANQFPAHQAAFDDGFHKYDWPWPILRKYKIMGLGQRSIIFAWLDCEQDLQHRDLCDKDSCKGKNNLESFKVFFVLAPEVVAKHRKDLQFESAEQPIEASENENAAAAQPPPQNQVENPEM